MDSANKMNWYPRSFMWRNLAKGYALQNELKDTEFLDICVKHYIKSQAITPEREGEMIKVGAAFYRDKGR
jgi:hypothetical protein